MTKTLLIGCGNIGAMYDWHREDVLTYAKALSRSSELTVFVHDFNRDRQRQVADRYGFHACDDPSGESLEVFDLVCIASPTTTHFSYLEKAISAGVPVICCEKPVTYDPEEATALAQLYANGTSRVLVNYIRRFQPSYERLRAAVQELLLKERIQHVRINYKRGVMNNGSHALDLVQFLTGYTLSTDNHHTTEIVFDVFPQDPTLSGIIRQAAFDVQLTGHPHAGYPVFDCIIELSGHLITITNAGNDWSIATKEHPGIPLVSESGAIDCYMLPVISRLQRMLEDSSINDNFTESLLLNRRLLQFIMQQNHG